MCPECKDLARRVEALESQLGSGPGPIEPDFFYTAREVADRIRVSENNVYRLMESGAMATTRMGARKAFRVRGSAILSFLEHRQSGGPAPPPPAPGRPRRR